MYVPAESIGDYKAAAQWKDFYFIGEFGVEDVMIDETDNPNQLIEVYNLNGIKVGNTVDGLPAGIYIIKQGKKSKR